MDRLRPGDVSPTATLPDDYRATHDVSPISPVIESRLSKRSVSRRWRTLPNEYFDVSPQTPVPEHHDWLVTSDAQPVSTHSHSSTPCARQRWPKEVGSREIPRIPLQDPTQTIPEEEYSLSLDSLQELVLEDGDDREKSPKPPTATATGLSEVTNFSPIQRSYWSPVWFQDHLLIGLGVAFAIMAVAILALYLVSSRVLGLGPSAGPAGLVYLWKYIPTAAIAGLLALWNNVDFTARLLQPWTNLKDGPASAERSIFLDLISTTWLWPSTFKIAAETWSTVPMFTILGVILLNVVMVLSTALLQVEITSMVIDGEQSLADTLNDKDDKIEVRIGAAAPVITLLLACLGLSIVVLFKRSYEVVPRDPRSIGSIALLLQCSPELSQHFRSSFEHLRYHLQHERFMTTVPKTSGFQFAIVREAMNPTFQPANRGAQKSDNPTWWQPVPLRFWYRVIAIVFPLLLIGALEGVQQVSNRSGGIVSVTSPNTAHYAFTIIPAIVMWSVGVIYASLNFNTVLLAPYYALAKGSPADRSLFNRDLGRLPVMQLMTSLRQGRITTACTALSATIGPWLTIVVSGLYSAVPIKGESRIVQNNAPKLALQVLLGVMALCVTISWLSMQTSGLLPHCPCSIAGVAALLAGGGLWKGPEEERRDVDIPRGMEWMSDDELKKDGLWNDTVFGLGWWPDGRYGIDAGGRIDEG
ncbi:hypothetical protein BKA67DRAFT_206486 [Truncatella angustata]|uniref:Uncharacterized protein n=1 Tax=Truncatella angustata TaxID=152316 RepID=A0A9P8UTX8_9PEZI|nr:uncharacterized protein BKA67DRAFT_206486 [Truncatella angustata]KAH6658111.1 hypothetical protein BKA67DRAFT_206486 [Truncatella angustata]